MSYVIVNNTTDEYFSDYSCGCVVWKKHISRGLWFDTKEGAETCVIDLELADVTIVKQEKEYEI